MPIGNGHLAAMCAGDPCVEHLQVNDAWVWRGAPVERRLAAGAAQAQRRAREDALAGDLDRAEAATRAAQGGDAQMYQPYLDMHIDYPDCPDAAATGPDVRLERRLDLATATASAALEAPGLTATSATTVSRADDVLLDARAFSRPVDLSVRVASIHDQDVRAVALALPIAGTAPGTGTALRLIGRLGVAAEVDPHRGGTAPTRPPHRVDQSVHASSALELRTDGTVGPVDHADPDVVSLSGATRLELRLASVTSIALDGTLRAPDHDGLEREALAAIDALTPLPHDVLVARAERAHAELYDRCALDLAPARGPAPDPGSAEGGPEPSTEEGLVALRDDPDADPRPLVELLAHMGRYLLLTVAGTAETPPGNPQGIWNHLPEPPWFCDDTLNINLPMTYWPAGPAHLSETGTGLAAWLDVLARSGRRTAAEQFEAPGWAAFHNSDRWGYAGSAGQGEDDPSWSAWPLGGAWLASTLVDLFRFAPGGLPSERLGLVEEAARFALALLVEMPDGTLGTAPSTSPENTFVAPDGTERSVHVSTTSDVAIIRELLTDLADLAADGSPVETGLLAAARTALARLPRERILPSGLPAEWSDDALVDVDPRHRHRSHLIGVFPGTGIDIETEPALAGAALRSLRERGLESTGWSLAWRVCLAARHGEGDLAEQLLRRALHPWRSTPTSPAPPGRLVGGVYRSMLCAHPPFQIDGNLGALTGVLEMLLQSHRRAHGPDGSRGARRLELLPALPSAWPVGSARGLVARDAIVVDLDWDREEVRADLRAAGPDPVEVEVRCGAHGTHVRLDPGSPGRIRLPRDEG